MPALRAGGTMSGGAVMDSDPATMVALRTSRTKKVAVAAGAAVVVMAGLGRWWGAGGEGSDVGAPEAGSSVPTIAASATAQDSGSTASAPAPSTDPATASGAPSASAPATSSASSSKTLVPGSTKPVRTVGPKASASAPASAKKDPRIGW